MSDIDRQRISAVKTLQQLGFAWHQGAWSKPSEAALLPEADALHGLLMQRADFLEGCTEGSPEEAEFASIAETLCAYEEKRWPSGKVAGGKG